MSFRSKLILVFVSVGISLYAMLPGILGNFFPTFAQQPINDAGAQIRIFESVLQHIQNDYVDEPNLEKVRSGALRGLAYGLDPYSSYLTAEQVKDFQAKKQNTIPGVGAEFSQVSGYLYVISVVKGSPAEKAGLKAGDFVEYIENKATRDISLYDARQLLLGDAGSKIKLRVLRPNVKAQTIEITRGSYKIPEVEVKIEEGKIGNIKVYSLEEGEANDIRNQVQQLQKQGVQKIVLDLRGVSAGPITEAVAVANLFIKDGELGQVIGRENKVLKTYTAEPGKFLFDGKLVVLIDLGTAGAGEIIASAVLDRQRGEVVGERSFGAGTEQQLFTLRGGDGLLLTTSKWASATGKAFLGDDRANSGVKPSVEVKRNESSDEVDPEELSEQNENEQAETPNPNDKNKPAPEDIQLKKALELLSDKAMQKAA
ncbi:MAG: PDZ domain-containing protein [Blastocatellia bacterium]|nr:PDZ domain-containing protein [Blastocatellia bacterium]